MRLPGGQDDLARHQGPRALELVRCRARPPDRSWQYAPGPDRARRDPRRRGLRAVRRAATGRGRRTSAMARARRRRCPADNLRWTVSTNGLEPELVKDAPLVGCVDRGRTGREPQVLADREIVIAGGLVSDESDQSGGVLADRRRGPGRAPPPSRSAAARGPASKSEQRRLARTVAAREQDDLAFEHVEIDASEGGEAAEEAHGRTQTDDGLHSVSEEQVPRAYGAADDWRTAPIPIDRRSEARPP